MPVPDIFAEGDPSEAKLAGYFEEMYDFLWTKAYQKIGCQDPGTCSAAW